MNSIIRRFGKEGLKYSQLNLTKMFVNINTKYISSSFGAKKLPDDKSTATSGSGNKVKNVSTKKAKVETEEDEEVEVVPAKKKKPTPTSESKLKEEPKKKVVEVVPSIEKKKRGESSAKKKVVKVEEESENIDEEEEAPVVKKSNKIPQRAIHTMQSKPVAVAEKPEKSEKTVKVGKVVKVVKVDKVDKVDKSDKVDKVDKIVKSEKIKVEKPKADKIEKPKSETKSKSSKPSSSSSKKSKKAEKSSTSSSDTDKEIAKPEETAKPEEEAKPTEVKKRPSSKRKEDHSEFPKVDLNNIGRVRLETELDPKKYTTNPKGTYYDYIESKTSLNTKNFINAEREFLCNNYAPLPVICARGKDVYLQDIDGHIYIDFLSAYSAVNHGHCNPNIIKAAQEQMVKLHMTSRAFYNNVLAMASQMICKLFSYEKVLFMNSGVEAGESAVKIARRWGYVDKGIPDNHAKMVFANGNFWGRSLYACATSDDPSRYEKFGPFEKDTHYMVDFGKIEQIESLLEADKNICAIFLEPIQGENGVVVPPPGYLTKVSELCKKHNVLLILDEIQTGIGRAGYLLAAQMENVHADITLLGKSLSGGFYPISAVLAWINIRRKPTRCANLHRLA